MRFILSFFLLISFSFSLLGQPYAFKYNKERELRYTPQGEDFVIINGDKRFNRALYGTNTAFRVETSDIPEFGLFMPGMGGNIQFGIVTEKGSLWLNNAEHITSRYRAGSRIYEISDPLIFPGKLLITALAMSDAEGIILKVEPVDISEGCKLVTVFGGASNRGFYRNGDLGVDDPEAFSLKADGCLGNIYDIKEESFSVVYGENTKNGPRTTVGAFSNGSVLGLSSPYAMGSVSDVLDAKVVDDKPILMSQSDLSNGSVFIGIKLDDGNKLSSDILETSFNSAETKRQEIAGTVKIHTPDSYLNTLGGALSVAADGIWDDATEVWQHGAIGWRMPLNGWRAAYVGDAIGWHDRARKHFDGYAASQITNVEPVISHPAQDHKLNMARSEKKWGTQMYSNGYICRNPRNTSQMHHYNMNLVYIDELLWHFNWTGDIDYVKQMWPVLERHLAWEKRNFDPDGDGLYDSYACIWASDALQYNSGGVTFSSAYNYRANRMAAQIAEIIGKDPAPYRIEAEKIFNAINSVLWMPRKGWWAEYKDTMGAKMIHPNAGLWTIYHAIDSEVHTPFQAYEATRYIDSEIPHLPVTGKGLDGENYYTLSTTNWLPYSWSVNNVAFAEVGHTSLAYWQAGRADDAFLLFKSNILDGMYLGTSPGNIGQVSYYDAARGECYRDFADPIGVYSRALVQGLYGIIPDAMNDKIVIRPGFPSDWQFASIETPSIYFDFNRDNVTDRYKIKLSHDKSMALSLLLKAPYSEIKNILVNGKNVDWSIEESVNTPMVRIDCAPSFAYDVVIEWGGDLIVNEPIEIESCQHQPVDVELNHTVSEVYDPQTVIDELRTSGKSLSGIIAGELGNRTIFVKVEQGSMEWWQPVSVYVDNQFDVEYDSEVSKLSFAIKNNSDRSVAADIYINGKELSKGVIIPAYGTTSQKVVADEDARFGTNLVELVSEGNTMYRKELTNWNIDNGDVDYEMVNMDKYLNASVYQIFKNEYLSPRSPYTTLQIPTQGIGEWCHPNLTANIDDSGLRNSTKDMVFKAPFGIPFRTFSDQSHNIAFTTLWDNYPSEVTIPLTGKSSHAYLMMSGSTNHMQSHVINGTVTVTYYDNSVSVLELVNPETWMPIEQDFYFDNYAFGSKLPRPYRVAFKTGKVSRTFEDDIDRYEVYERDIDGGAGVFLDIPLDETKELKSIEVKSIANEVVIGLMAITLVR